MEEEFERNMSTEERKIFFKNKLMALSPFATNAVPK
jgi:hypothetical protein